MKKNSALHRALAPSPLKLGFLLVLISTALYYNIHNQKPQFLRDFDNRLTDIMFQVRGPQPTSGEVAIVAIDQKSINQFGQWPWPRNIIAQLIDTIALQTPSSVGLDMVFAGPDRTSPQALISEILPHTKLSRTKKELQQLQSDKQFNYDLTLGAALTQIPSVLAYTFVQDADQEALAEEAPSSSLAITTAPENISLTGSDLFVGQRAIINNSTIGVRAKTQGFRNIVADSSGVVRQTPVLMLYKGKPYPSLALEIFRIGKNEKQAIIRLQRKPQTIKQVIAGVSIGNSFFPADEKGQLLLNYRGPIKQFTYISAADILSGNVENDLSGKHIIVGISAQGLSETFATPYAGNMPGIEIQASIIDNLIAGDPLKYDFNKELITTYSLLVAGGLVLTAILAFTPPLIGGLCGIIVLLAPLAAGYFFFLQDQVIGITYPLVVLALVYICVAFFKFFFAGQEKRFLRNTFRPYVSPATIKKIIRNPAAISLRGEIRELTVLFCDISGFTAIAERMSPDRLHLMMNEYFTAMSDLVIKKEGMVDKYMGDSLMAVWGAPLPVENPEIKAVQSALDSLTVLKELQGSWRRKGFPKIKTAMGICTGKVRLGNFGSERRFDYTVIGHNVNAAARLEGLNKVFGTHILISERTQIAVKQKIPCRFIASVRLKKTGNPVKIFEPMEVETFKGLKTEISHFEKALEVYNQREFKQAHILFNNLKERNPLKLYDMYIERSAYFSLSPPASDWDGSFSFIE